jgi:Phosphate transporter family
MPAQREVPQRTSSRTPSAGLTRLQVLTACCDSFAHGANDVANSIGPFAAIYEVYRKSDIQKKSPIPIWILIIGASGIVVGLSTCASPSSAPSTCTLTSDVTCELPNRGLSCNPCTPLRTPVITRGI